MPPPKQNKRIWYPNRFSYIVSYTNMLKKKVAIMPGKRELKQHSHRRVELRKAILVSNYSLHVAFHKTTPKYKMSAISTQ
jgi:hypothetical protein